MKRHFRPFEQTLSLWNSTLEQHFGQCGRNGILFLLDATQESIKVVVTFQSFVLQLVELPLHRGAITSPTMKVLVAAIVFLAIAAFPASAQCPAKKKKNLLFITADQFRADALRYAQERRADYAGFEKVDTPNLDALAESGAYFENAYVVSQNCVPSRATFTTGLTLQRSGVTHSNLLSEKVYTRHPSFKERILSSRTYEMILSDELGYWVRACVCVRERGRACACLQRRDCSNNFLAHIHR